MKYLFIGAHTDDIELGCGGTIAKLVENGHEVTCYTFSSCESLNLIEEHSKSMNLLGVQTFVINNYRNRTMPFHRQKMLDDLHDFKMSYYPDFVFTHDPSDIHQDHQSVSIETIRAFKFSTIYSYSFPWNSYEQNPNYFIGLKKKHIDLKIEALHKYQSQSHRHYMFEDVIVTNATYWTNHAPFYNYCEAFKVISQYD
jgi:LmbE family N-acetylglucosaminyl deacetylase